ncbi:MAG: tetratricopeptide repeat protein, partial [Cyanobacteria bacterium P01_H01_bin.130]
MAQRLAQRTRYPQQGFRKGFRIGHRRAARLGLAIAFGLILALLPTLLRPMVSTAADSADEGAADRAAFIRLCEGRSRLGADTRYTVDLMLQKAKTEDCTAAAATLSALPTFEHTGGELRDIAPIALFKHWQNIMLVGNQIEDISPLAGQRNLNFLIVAMNRVTDISPLTQIPSLRAAVLEGNQIQTVPEGWRSPPLQSLNLLNNPLKSKICPVRPAQICEFSDGGAAEFQAGEQALDEGDFSEAIAAYTQAQGIYQRENDLRRVVRTYDRLGDVSTRQGNFSDALRKYRDAYTMAQDLGDLTLLGSLMTSQAELYERLGQYDQAVSWLFQAQANARQQEAGPIPMDGGIYELPRLQGEIHRWLGRVQLRQGDLLGAMKQAQESLKQYERLPEGYPEKRSGLRRTWTLLGEVQRQLSLLDQSVSSLQKALTFAQGVGDRPGESLVLQQQGLTYTAMRQWDQAEASLNRAVLLAQNSGAQVAAGQALTALGLLSVERENERDAIRQLTAAVEQWEALRPGLADENKISLADAQADTYTWLIESLLADDQPEAALVAAERARARAFVELLATRLNGMALDRTMEKSTPLTGAVATNRQQKPLTLKEIKRLARDQGATIVEYAIGHKVLHSWVIQPDGEIIYHPLTIEPPTRSAGTRSGEEVMSLGGRLEKRIFDVRFSLTVPGNFFEEERAHLLLRDLYDDLIRPLAADLPTDPDQPILIVPQGKLFLLPFAALKPDADHYWVENHPIYLSSAIQASVLKAKKRSQGQPSNQAGEAPGALVVGNPVMPSVPPRVGAPPQPLEPLPGAEREAETISQLLQSSP